MPIRLRTTSGLTGTDAPYVLFVGGPAVAMTELAGNDAGWYQATDAAIAAAGVGAGSHTASVLRGDSATPDPSDAELGQVHDFRFDGTNELLPVTPNDSVASVTNPVDLVDAPNATAVNAIQSGLAKQAKLDTLHDTRITGPRAANLDNLDTQVSSIEGTPIADARVDEDHTWSFDSPSQMVAPRDIHENVGFYDWLAMDFDEPIPDDASLQLIGSVTVTPATNAPTVEETKLSPDKTRVFLHVDARTSAGADVGVYTFAVPITHTVGGGGEQVRKGRLVLS